MIIQKLTEAEELTMKAIWDCQEEPGLKQVLSQINDIYDKGWKSQTVSTFIHKLCKKKYLKLQGVGKYCTYKVLVDEASYKKEQLNKLYLFLYKNDKEKMKSDLEEL